jgi:hypothetical protein
MTPEQAQSTQLGSAFLAAYLREDHEAVDLLGEEFREDLSRLADSLAYVALVAATMLSKLRGSTLEAELRSAPPVRVVLVENFPIDWESAVRLCLGVSAGNTMMIAAATSNLDQPTAINSVFTVALSATEELARATGKTPLEWAEVWAVGAALNPPLG